MVLNGFAEFTRNLLICKDERVAVLLEVVEVFKQRYTETAKKIDAGYLVSALNILNEAEINYRSARNKRLHVELALIKLCYLQQALELTANGTTIDKKKIVDSAKAIAFKAIQPISSQPVKTEVKSTGNKPVQSSDAKLIIETKVEKKTAETVQEPATGYDNGNGKLKYYECLTQGDNR